jgi:hypothetical protein
MDKIIHIQRRERSDHHFIFEDADFSIATVRQGIVNLTDPIEKYLPASVKVPEFNGHKITFDVPYFKIVKQCSIAVFVQEEKGKGMSDMLVVEVGVVVSLSLCR